MRCPLYSRRWRHRPSSLTSSRRASLAISLTALVLPGMVLLFNPSALATPPYGDPNQPYDRLPGTLETFHVKWAKPLAGGKLKVLFILPYSNSREVVELAQRLDLEYTVIMEAGANVWSEGAYEGENATPLHGIEASRVLDRLSRERLDLTRAYDAIVIGKVSWDIIPGSVRTLILQHVDRGTGLVYVSPSAKSQDQTYSSLFLSNADPGIAGKIIGSLPFDIMPIKVIDDEAFKGLPAPPKRYGRPLQQPVSIRGSTHGKGKIVVIDYHDGGKDSDDSLTACVFYDRFLFDYQFALLARAVLRAAGREPAVQTSISFDAPRTDLSVPEEELVKASGWDAKTPTTVIARSDLPRAKVVFAATSLGAARPTKLDYMIRDVEGSILQRGDLEGNGAKSISLPMLARGNYTADLRVLDAEGRVLDFMSRSFRVEDAQRVTKTATDKEDYGKGERITGTVSFSLPLAEQQEAVAWATDTWDRTVYRVEVKLRPDRMSGTFSLPVEQPLSRLWDIHCAVRDSKGEVDSRKTWVGLPDWNFDDYLWALIFSTHPDNNWKGDLYTRALRPYGINASNVYLIYSMTYLYELNERYHLQSISYAEHLGELGLGTGQQYFFQGSYEKELALPSLAELSRMIRFSIDSGEPIDIRRFPEAMDFGAWKLDGNWINERMKTYKESLKFGSPYYFLTGENYLSGEGSNKENSGFSPWCTKLFQDWCRGQYRNDLNALNAEWGSEFKSWEEVRGILLTEAVEKNQLPRWVDFRYFMRSRVWSQFFIDWTDLARRALGREVRTGTNGHDHHDFSRYRNHMTSGKLYVGQEINSEWRTCVAEELHQSFSGDKSFLLAAQSMIRWNIDFQTELDRKRWPWKALFAGYRGFDWERGLSGNMLGGETCFTPDYSEPLPFFRDMSEQVRYLQRGIGKLAINAKPARVPVAILWAPYNHYISRLLPFQENGFTGTWLYNIAVDGGAIGDCLVLMKSLRMRPTFLAPEDLAAGALRIRGFKALLLPYSKGMSEAEAAAIKEFVKEGGLVIADNEPATFTEHGRKLESGRLAELFPTLEKENIVTCGKGVAAYLPNGINGYLGRFEQCNYKGSDSVAALLARYAGVTPEVELIDGNGVPRRDTLMPVYVKGSACFVGMLRHSLSQGKDTEETTIKLKEKSHVWDVREGRYLGYADTFKIKLDMNPRFLALLPANPEGIRLKADRDPVRQGETLNLSGEVLFRGGEAEQIKDMGEVVHVEVWDPAGAEVECFRTNQLFGGRTFRVCLPISYSERPGKYAVRAEYPITGLKTETFFRVEGKRAK